MAELVLMEMGTHQYISDHRSFIVKNIVKNVIIVETVTYLVFLVYKSHCCLITRRVYDRFVASSKILSF